MNCVCINPNHLRFFSSLRLHSTEWGTIPSNLSTKPKLNARKASRKVANHASRSLTGGETCPPELQILTMTPSSANDDFGNGYKYTLVWKVCPTLERQEQEIMEGIVDAQTGQVYSFVDKVDYLEATGGVYPLLKRWEDSEWYSRWCVASVGR